MVASTLLGCILYPSTKYLSPRASLIILGEAHLTMDPISIYSTQTGLCQMQHNKLGEIQQNPNKPKQPKLPLELQKLENLTRLV